MKHFLQFCLILVCGALVFGCAVKADSTEDMLAAAKALDQQFLAAYNDGDVDAVMAAYWNSPDMVSYPPDVLEVRGWQASKEALEHSFSSMPGGHLELIEMNYQVAGDVVFGWGKWRMVMTPPGGMEMSIVGRYTDIKAKRDGKWVYILDHASVPMPPPPDGN